MLISLLTLGAGVVLGFGIGLLLVGTLLDSIERTGRTMPLGTEVRVALHGVRRRLEVAQVRVAIKGDAARLRRELDGELRDIEKGGQ